MLAHGRSLATNHLPCNRRGRVSPPTGLAFVTANVTQGLTTPASQNRASTSVRENRFAGDPGLPGAPVRTWDRLVRALRRWSVEALGDSAGFQMWCSLPAVCFAGNLCRELLSIAHAVQPRWRAEAMSLFAIDSGEEKTYTPAAPKGVNGKNH